MNLAKTLGRWMLLGVVCVAVYFSLSLPYNLKQQILAAVNTTTIVFTMTAETWNRGDLVPRTGSLSGHGFAGQCFEHDQVIEDRLNLHALPPDPHRLVCRIDTGLRSEEGRERTIAMIAAMRFPPQWKLGSFGWYDGLLGYRFLAENLLDLAEVCLWMLVFCLLFDLRQDWANARALLCTQPRWVLLPPFAKMAGLALGHAATNYFLAIDLKVTRFIGSMIHAPVVEEILFRAIFFTLIAKYSNVWFSALYVSAIFAFDHGYSPAGTFGVFTSALALQYLYVRYKSVTLCVMAHMFINAAPYFAYLLKLKSSL